MIKLNIKLFSGRVGNQLLFRRTCTSISALVQEVVKDTYYELWHIKWHFIKIDIKNYYKNHFSIFIYSMALWNT